MRVATLLLGLFVAALAAAIALEVFPEELLGDELTATLYDPYNTTPLGIYFREPRAQMNVMWPSLELEAYSHSYFWTHRTDARGFRNPAHRQDPRILLLGDSMIYGHGVDEEQTAASVLHREHGLPVYNMARQGDCIYEHYRLLRLYLDELAPRTVLLFAFTNDLVDLAKTGALAGADRPPEIDEYDYAAIRRSIDRLGRQRPPAPLLSRFVLGRLVASRSDAVGEKTKGGASGMAQGGMLLALRKRGILPQNVETVDLALAKQIVSMPEVRAQLERGWRALDATELAPAALYYRRVLRDLGDRCRAKGARLVLVNLALDQGGYWRAQVKQAVADVEKRAGLAVAPDAARYVEGVMYDARLKMAAQVGSLVAEVAREERIDCLDLSALFTARENYLANDGHLSETGHRLLADHLRRFLSRAP